MVTLTSVRTISYRDAIQEAIYEEMLLDERVIFLGEDLANGGAFGVVGDLPERVGQQRFIHTPISENSFVGVAVGAAMTGMRPIVEIMFMDFMTLAMDQIVNHAAKIHYMYAGQYEVPLVVRTPAGAGRGYGASHSQSFESWLIQVPGLKVIAPSNPDDAKGLLKSAIRDNNPVIFIENKLLYPKKQEVVESDDVIPIGVARLRRVGHDVTLVSYGRMLDHCLEAAMLLATEGLECDVIDLRTLKPLDLDTIMTSVTRTRRLVCVEEGTGGVGAEICSRVAESCPGTRVARVAARDVPIPSSGPLEMHVIPQVADIINGCLATLE
jgi:pyruvate/2-oxoglutarate/acetoin dehydrogenase E1 component